MGVTSDKSFSEKELAELAGETPRQKAEAVVRRGSSLLPPAATVGLALLFSLTGTGFGEVAGALLIFNAPRIFTTVVKFAPKK